MGRAPAPASAQVRAASPLAYGDDGLNMTVAQSSAELVSYMKTIHDARPNIKFILLEAVIHWPYDGRAGYTSVPYPQNQRPDFEQVWEELTRAAERRWTASSRWPGCTTMCRSSTSIVRCPQSIAWPTTGTAGYSSSRPRSRHRVLQFGQHFNSLWGGGPTASTLASGPYFQAQVLHAVEEVRGLSSSKPARRDAMRPLCHGRIHVLPACCLSVDSCKPARMTRTSRPWRPT